MSKKNTPQTFDYDKAFPPEYCPECECIQHHDGGWCLACSGQFI